MPDPRSLVYDEACRRCPRLASFLADVSAANPTYWCKPVPPFGESAARLVIVGLAPGMHGANASGRPFTGDYAGILLYETLHRYGFANRPVATARGDGLRLTGCRITNAVKCLPPENKPAPARSAQLQQLSRRGPAHGAGGRRHPRARPHRARCRRWARWACAGRRIRSRTAPSIRSTADGSLIDSYHCSRYNTNTRRLTPRDVPRGVRPRSPVTRRTARKRGGSEQSPAPVQGDHAGTGRRGAGARRSTRPSS